jgi:phospholipid-binding lipoprotein MlaA
MSETPLFTVLICSTVYLLSGCASVAPSTHEQTPNDPWQTINRPIFGFNRDVDRAILKPIAQGYQKITPEPVNRGISHFFNNLHDVTSAVNHLLQFKLYRASSDVSRVAINSTVGALGFFDVATNIGIPSYNEDFGQTLGYWGLSAGPYMVLPFLGPSSLRDSLGLIGDYWLDPSTYLAHDNSYRALQAVRIIDQRADTLKMSAIFDQAALDPYSLARDTYLQQREHQVHDGTLPSSESTW